MTKPLQIESSSIFWDADAIKSDEASPNRTVDNYSFFCPNVHTTPQPGELAYANLDKKHGHFAYSHGVQTQQNSHKQHNSHKQRSLNNDYPSFCDTLHSTRRMPLVNYGPPSWHCQKKFCTSYACRHLASTNNNNSPYLTVNSGAPATATAHHNRRFRSCNHDPIRNNKTLLKPRLQLFWKTKKKPNPGRNVMAACARSPSM